MIRHLQQSLLAVLLIGISISISLGAAEVPALTPEVQTAEWAQSWWMPRHKEKLAEVQQRKDKVDLLFLGDSITQAWEDRGREVWDTHYQRRRAINLGFSGDRTEHVLWRLQNGEVEGLSPKLVVLMIGTNNTGHRQDPAADTVAGIRAILGEIETRMPQSQVLLLAVFPRGATPDDPLRRLNSEINARIATLANKPRVHFLDINRIFLEKDGRLPRNVMPDRLHPNALGYRMWARAMEPKIRELMGEKPELGDPTVIDVWPGDVPDEVCSEAERGVLGADRGVLRISNVSKPTLSLFPGRKTRQAKRTVLVLPGGGYSILAFNLEGTEIAGWLNRAGYAAAVLKYRVPRNRPGALQDAQRALGLLRQRAGEWGLDPNRMGVLGFSAGGHLAASLSNHYHKRAYSEVDAADRISCRPDFTVLIYPAYLGATDSTLADDIPVTEQTPPAFILQTQDDRRLVSSSTAYYLALSRVKVSAELHLFPTGGHGYGLRPSAYPVSQWPELCETWMMRLK